MMMRRMNPAILLAVLLVYFLPLVLAGDSPPAITRADFPEDFVFGSGTSAYQYEGAALEDGRALTLWDIFTHEGKTDGGTGDVASDGYHKYKEDIKLLHTTGIEAYKFSLSWSRLLPGGRGTVNSKAVEYYNSVINELLKYGIQPHVTLHHMDFPLVFEQEYGGWLSSQIIDDFKEYADVCFREFGDRVTHWTTMTEPNIYAMDAYDNGRFPPNRCSYPFGKNCKEGNSTTEPYIGAHNMILSHAAAAKLYRTKYQAIQKGKIGFNVYTIWASPLTNSKEDKMAAKRVLDFMPGWIVNPMVFGDYPEIMRKKAGSRLPSFTESESKEVKGSFDFLGINYYFSTHVSDNPDASKLAVRDFSADMFAKFSVFKDDIPIPQLLPPGRIPNRPLGLLKMLKHIKTTYGNPPIYIHENGCGLGESDMMNDTWRITYMGDHIGSVHKALRDGSDVRGYLTWSFLDVFELLKGYKTRFGLYHVDFASKELTRIPKLSARWYSDFLKNGGAIKIRKVGQKASALQIQ